MHLYFHVHVFAPLFYVFLCVCIFMYSGNWHTHVFIHMCIYFLFMCLCIYLTCRAMKLLLPMLLKESISVNYTLISYSISEDFSFKLVLNFN